MATRSRIAIERPDGSVRSIYCHWDGSPDTNGKCLADHYQDRRKVEKLIKLGDLSSLHKSVEPTGPHTFSNPQEGVTVAYHRDRGEERRGPRLNHDKAQYLSSDVEEYGYLFTSADEWVYVSYGDRRPRKCSEI
jgi:hypothetical protein